MCSNFFVKLDVYLAQRWIEGGLKVRHLSIENRERYTSYGYIDHIIDSKFTYGRVRRSYCFGMPITKHLSMLPKVLFNALVCLSECGW